MKAIFVIFLYFCVISSAFADNACKDLKDRVQELEGQQDQLTKKLIELKNQNKKLNSPDSTNCKGKVDETITEQEKICTKQQEELDQKFLALTAKNFDLEARIKSATLDQIKQQKLDAENKKTQHEVEFSSKEINSKFEKAQQQISSLSGDLSSTRLSLEAAQKSENALKEEKVQLEKLKAANHEQISNLNSKISEKDIELNSQKLKINEQETILLGLPELKKEILSLKNELLMRQEESKFSTPGNKIERTPRPSPVDPRSQNERDKLLETYGKNAGDRTISGKSDVMVIEVTEDKVNLRTGAGPENAPVMQVQKGTRLTVEAREGDWYRVVTPTGTRAYIRDDVTRKILDPATKSSEIFEKPPIRPGKKIPQNNDMEPFGNVDNSVLEKMRNDFNRNLKKE